VHNRHPPPKKISWVKKEIREYNDEKCHRICYVNFHGLLGNLSAVVCVYISSVCMYSDLLGEDGRGGCKIGFFRNP
jgi:hypothetical protein